ncbi:hypothetical protein IJH72_02990 [Candidatus Saccharibacteria bacterium]|nr:hypothetical protein [Candidatus Saccharibacteria bacterium]
MDKTTGELRTLLELIIEQRANSKYDTFKYDFSWIQKKLKQTQDFEKYSITPKRQRELLKQLDGNKYLRLEYVEESGCKWKHDGKWIAEYIAPNFDPLFHITDIYISLTPENVRPLRMEYGLESYDAKLILEFGRFAVKCNGKIYELQQLRESGLPAKILEYAWKHRNSTIDRDELIANEIIRGRGGESLRKICKGSKEMIEKVLSPFITMTANSITLTSSSDISELELQVIANYAVAIKEENKG